ncbi:MAG: hypothetical protein LM590_02950 [Thermofilum sp.]|nr:hypothetical protein [Thermofilum sp.]
MASLKMGKCSSLPLLLLLVALLLPQSFYSQPSEQIEPVILFASAENEALLYGGFVRHGGASFPLFGLATSTKREAYFIESTGFMLSAAAHRGYFFFAGTTYLRGLPAILLVVMRNETLAPKVIYSELPLFGVDLLPVNSTLYITGYVYRYSPLRESDIILVKYNYVTGEIEDSAVLGSIAYDDYPKRLLSDGKNIIIVGETYSYNVSQSDILVVKLKPDLTLVNDMAIGGAGPECVEDALLTADGTLLIVGSTTGRDGTADAFIARVSEVEGLLYLTAVTGYGNEYAISASKLKDSYLIALHGEFEEEKTHTLILNYTLRRDLELQSVLIANSSVGDTTPLKSHSTGLVIETSNLVAEIYPEEKALCIGGDCPPLAITLVDFKEYVASLLYTLHGWKPTYSVVKRREKPKLYVTELQQQLLKMNLSTASLSITTQPYARKIDLAREAIKLVERNTPLLLFTPMIAATVLVACLTKKKRK